MRCMVAWDTMREGAVGMCGRVKLQNCSLDPCLHFILPFLFFPDSQWFLLPPSFFLRPTSLSNETCQGAVDSSILLNSGIRRSNSPPSQSLCGALGPCFYETCFRAPCPPGSKQAKQSKAVRVRVRFAQQVTIHEHRIVSILLCLSFFQVLSCSTPSACRYIYIYIYIYIYTCTKRASANVSSHSSRSCCCKRLAKHDV
jgi:hypothetical protein